MNLIESSKQIMDFMAEGPLLEKQFWVVKNGDTTLMITDKKSDAEKCHKQWKTVTKNSKDVTIEEVDEKEAGKMKKTPSGNTGYPKSKVMDLEDMPDIDSKKNKNKKKK